MPKYRITAPDGKTYEVNAPDGASKDDVLNYVKQNYQGAAQQAQPQQPVDKEAAYQALQTQNAADSSGLDNFAAGAGKSVVDNYRGIQQLSAGLGSLLPSFLGGDYYSNTYNQLKQEQSDANRRDAALMQTKAGMAGNVAGQVGQAAVGGSALKAAGVAAQAPTYAQTSMSGGLQGLLQPLSSDDTEGQRGLNAGLGSLAGVTGRGLLQGGASLLKNGAQTVAGWLLPKASPEVANLASSAINDFGIPLKASQVAPSRVAKTLDSVSAKVPFSGAQDFGQTQQQAFNRAVAGTIGEDADQITPAIYARAKQRIGGVYDDITSRNQVNVTPDVQQKLAGVLQDAQQTGSDDSIRAVQNLLGRIDSQSANGALPGDAYQSIQSQLGNIAKAGGEKANYAGQVRGILRDALNDSISPEDQAAWQMANQQYGNLKTIRNLVTKDAVNGDISPSQLLGRVTGSNAGKEAVASGRGGDLSQLASIGQQFLKDGIPNSGTPERLAAFGLLGAGGLANLPSAVSAVAGARGYQALMQSPQVLAKVLQDPSIDQATKSAIISRLGAAGGLLGQQSALARQRYAQSVRAPALLQASP